MGARYDQIDALLQFANGLSIALVVAFIAIYFRHALKFERARIYAVYDGIVFGIIGITIMLFPFPIVPGVALDVRIVPVVLGGMLSGPIGAAIAGTIVAANRLFIGGPGVVAGTGAIVTAAVFGGILAHRWRDNLHRITIGKLAVVGLGLAAITLGWTLTLPSDIVGAALSTFTVPVLITHPLGVVILGSLVFYEEKRRRTEIALRESQARLNAIVENSTASVYLKDIDGRYTLINQLYATRFGRRREEILGKTARGFFEPDFAAVVMGQDRQVIEREKPQTFETEVVYGDGTRHTEMAVKFPIFGPDNTISAIGGISADITELKRAGETARRNETLFREFFQKSRLLFLTLDHECRVTACNAHLLQSLGYREPEIIGRNWIDTFIPEPKRENVRQVFRQVVRGENMASPLHYENEILTRSGEKRRIMWDSVVLDDPAGDAQVVISVGADVTEQRLAEEEAQSLRDRLAHVARIGTLGEMATGFAHELNQPLAAINNYAQGVLRRMRSDKTQRSEIIQALESLSAQAERAGEIIRRIRWFVRKDTLSRQAIDLNHAILDALSFLKNEAQGASVTLDLDLDESLPEIEADAVQIQQVVINIVKNAIEAIRTVHGGSRRIDIETMRIGSNTVKVTVSDTGPGLPPEIAADLFEPFVTTKEDGMGIGLSICRSTVQAHGGELTAAARPGGGTVFRFTLPISTEP